MPSTPLICSSIGVDTVPAMTLGLAPGYCARTTTVGGATSGYSEIGSAGTDSSPATKISVDRTPATLGRSMKHLEKFMSCLVDILVTERNHPGAVYSDRPRWPISVVYDRAA